MKNCKIGMKIKTAFSWKEIRVKINIERLQMLKEVKQVELKKIL